MTFAVVMWLVSAWLISKAISDPYFVVTYNSDGTGSNWSNFIIVFSVLIGGFGGWRVFTFGQQLRQPDAWVVMAQDRRAPVILLRPFIEDARVTESAPSGQRFGGIDGQNTRQSASLEGKLVSTLKAIGPFIAVGLPQQVIAPLGASRLYLPHDNWQETVLGLIQSAGAIVLQPGEQAGVEWELQMVSRIVDPRRLMLIVPNPAERPIGYVRVRAVTGAYLRVPLPENPGSCNGFVFDAEGTPQPLLLKDNIAFALTPFVAQVRALSAPTFVAHPPAAGAPSATLTPSFNPGPFFTRLFDVTSKPSGAVISLGPFLTQLRQRIDRGGLYGDLWWSAFVALLTLAPGLNGGTSPLLRVILLAAFAAWAWLTIRRSMHRYGPFTLDHPLGKMLALNGDPANVTADIEADFAGQSPWGRTAMIGQRWIAHVRGHRFSVQRLDDIVWAYDERMTHRYNAIPYRITHTLVMWNRRNFAGAIVMPKRLSHAALGLLSARMPWLLINYSPKLKETWNADRGDFIALVDHQRRSTQVDEHTQRQAIARAEVELASAQQDANIRAAVYRGLALLAVLFVVFSILSAN